MAIVRPSIFIATVVSMITVLSGAAPVLAGSRSCSEPESIRLEVSDSTSTVNIANHRSTPLTIEWVAGRDEAINSLTLAPGDSKLLEIDQGRVLTSRDARRRCLSKFISDKESETWEIATALENDYQRRNVGSFPVYVAPEFSRDRALLERCLQVLESNVKQVEEVLPPAAWQKLSSIAIWLEYQPDKSYLGGYFASKEWLILSGVTSAKAKSIQFTSSLAVMMGSKRNPLMHELAHAYHDLVLSLSYAPIWSGYHSARLSGRYNAVRHSSGRFARAYAMTDHMEFFAELSEAYFGHGDFFRSPERT
jgi:hypothetical protein